MRSFFLFLLCGIFIFSMATTVRAATPTPTPKLSQRTTLSPTPTTATNSATATDSAAIATPSASVEQKIQEKTDKDITETSGKTKDKLVEFLDQHPIGQPTWHNFLQYAIRRAINNGLPANIVVLILLFPAITALISFSRHVIGLKGFGVYTPAVLAVAFVSTGIINGLLLFLIILAAAQIMKQVLKRLNLQYLPRTAMLLWGVSIIMLAVLISVSFVPANTILTVSIFPILIIMLLTENFMESQLSGSQSEATSLTIETLFIAILGSLLIGNETVQKYALAQPELMLLLVAVVNIIVGRYVGLRLLEWVRFRSVID